MIESITFENPRLDTAWKVILSVLADIYLVGGAVRDILLQRSLHDLDFVVFGDVRKTARYVANQLEGKLYMLDESRDTARVILPGVDGRPVLLDFAALRADTLEADLKSRDFTINALAFKVNESHKLIDPTGGLHDLHSKVLRACSAQAMMEDPIRILRGVRLALDLGVRIEPATYRQMHAQTPALANISSERVRDELFNILQGSSTLSALRLLDHVDALPYVLPEMSQRKSAPDLFEFTLAQMRWLHILLAAFTTPQAVDLRSNLRVGMAVSQFASYQTQLRAYLNQFLTADRSRKALILLAGLYNTVELPGPLTTTAEEFGRRNGNRPAGAELLYQRAVALALSQNEAQYVTTLVKYFEPAAALLAESEVSRRDRYRYYQKTDEAGVGLCFLVLANTLARFGQNLSPEMWAKRLAVCGRLFEAWFDKREEVVFPPRLVSGQDIQTIFGIRPGPVIGDILAALSEEQAAGEITTRPEALEFIRRNPLWQSGDKE